MEAVLGNEKGYLVELTVIFDPDTSSKTEPTSQRVHRDEKDGNRVTNFIIALSDGYLIRFFDENNEENALLVALQDSQFVQFSTEMHQGKVT